MFCLVHNNFMLSRRQSAICGLLTVIWLSFGFALTACMREQNAAHVETQHNPKEQSMDINNMQTSSELCSITHFHDGYEDEIIICALRKEDVERMHQLYNDAVEALHNVKFDSDEEMIGRIRNAKPKFHVVYPIRSLDDIKQLELDYRSFVPYATTFEVQFVNDIIFQKGSAVNDGDKRIHLRAKGNVAYRRLIFSGQTHNPTTVERLFINVNADTVVVHNLKFIHHSPAPAISVDVTGGLIADSVVFENSEEIDEQMQFAAEPLIVTFSTENRPYDVEISNSVFRNNHSDGLLGVDVRYLHPVRNITLRNNNILDNAGSFDISASEFALIERCTISQLSVPALILNNPNTKVTIRDSKLDGYVFKFFPSLEYGNSKPESVQRINNTEKVGTRYYGLEK